LAAISITLVGCKDAVRDMAACKVKAMEVYKPVFVETDAHAAEYVRNCMEAMGYHLSCDSSTGTFGYTLFSCYE